MNVGRKPFTELIATTRSAEERLIGFGALLRHETRAKVEIVGGSAIEIYLTSAEYVSQDVDLVGPKDAIAKVLHRWGFKKVDGRSLRTYWFHPDMGLIDLVGPRDRSGLPPRRIESPFGPAWISAPEPLIAHRLARAVRENGGPLLAQAIALARGRDLDWEYLEILSRYEGFEGLLRRLRKEVGNIRRSPKS